MKLALLDRRSADPAQLLKEQRILLAPIVTAIDEQPDGVGFDATLHAWRRSAARATLEFLDGLTG
jgi:PadR family transcriptional regulator AphA